MSKKKYNIENITNELEGGASLFFNRAKQQSQTPPQHPEQALPENQKSGIHENVSSGNQEFMNSRNQENMNKSKQFAKPEKFSTLIDPTLRKKVQQYALEHNMKDYKVLELALIDYFEKHK